MAQTKSTTITTVYKNNSKAPTTISSKTVEYVVKDNQLVVDDRDINPGVIINQNGNIKG